MDSETCEAEGNIVGIEQNALYVTTIVKDACGHCGGKSLCSSAKERTLKINVDDPSIFSVNQRITMYIPSRAGLIIVFSLYFISAIAAGIASAVVYLFTDDDIAAAITFLMTIIILFVIISVNLRGYASKQIKILP